MKAMIFAAGLGTRLKPLTNNMPKALVEVNGKPMLEILISKLKMYGFNEFVINVHHFADQIITYLNNNNNFGSKIVISDESNELLDTGGGILKAKEYLLGSDSFLVVNVDILTDINLDDLINEHYKNKALATLSVRHPNSDRLLKFDDANYLCRWENIQTNEIKQARDPIGSLNAYSFNGIHVIQSTIFERITETGKFSIIDLYLRLAKKTQISAYQSNYTYWFDLGKPENIIQAENQLSSFRPIY
jgi:NDP-sugar pyrophosphorylase family protein